MSHSYLWWHEVPPLRLDISTWTPLWDKWLAPRELQFVASPDLKQFVIRQLLSFSKHVRQKSTVQMSTFKIHYIQIIKKHYQSPPVVSTHADHFFLFCHKPDMMEVTWLSRVQLKVLKNFIWTKRRRFSKNVVVILDNLGFFPATLKNKCDARTANNYQ